MALRRWLRRLGIGAAGLCLVALGTGAILDRLYPPVLDRYQDRSAVVRDADGTVLRAFTSSDEMWRLPATVDDVTPFYLQMLVAYEDRRFWSHPGVDPLALARAFGQMVASGEAVSGGSTLTMQVVRLLEPRPRTLGSKLIEIARAIQLELHYSKEEILAMYLTLAPYGGNLEGIQAASYAYFGKPADALTPGEAAMLVVLPQSPTRWRPDRDMTAALAAREKVLRRAFDYGVIDARQLAEALEEPLPTGRTAMPFDAPQLAQRLVTQATAGGGPAPVIDTTIDGRLQRAMQDLAQRALTDLDPQANVAILVVDNATGAVRAYVGSGDFFAEAREGQVDLVQAVRSPGSTLKPFIYGMAFEDLLLHPQTYIDDTPMRFGDYDPTNFDGGYHGRLTVREALQRSLNVPAVAVLDRLGPTRLATRLRQCGMTLNFPGLDPTAALPLALGGVGVTLWDLTQAYAALANGGAVRPLHVAADVAPTMPERDAIVSPAAAWYLTDILAGTSRPDDVLDPAFRLDGARIAYKTGTSYGYRDAWAIGYDARTTIGVWVGRPDGNSSPQRTGHATAAPILFQAFGLIPDPGRGVVGPAPDGVIDQLTADLPSRLLSFDARPGPAVPLGTISVSQDLRIDFPVDGSTVALPSGPSGQAPLPLVAAGGARPFVWMVNGAPIPASAISRQTAWRPDGPGQARITVIDANGESASAEIWVQ
ncbi:MAG: penicillin-binding protein 1C [Alphaproteobacteria bacterium]